MIVSGGRRAAGGQAEPGAVDAMCEAVGAALQQLKTPHCRRVARLAANS